MEGSDNAVPLPAYSFVPGGPWPHPNRSPAGTRIAPPPAATSRSGARTQWWSARFLRGVELFNAGYYWEAHEVWEELWHVEGRRGPTADVLKALIKLAAAGVKVREGREHGVRTHCRRAARVVRLGGRAGGRRQLGLDLDLWAERCRELAENPPRDPGPAGAPVTRVFAFGSSPNRAEADLRASAGLESQATTC